MKRILWTVIAPPDRNPQEEFVCAVGKAAAIRKAVVDNYGVYSDERWEEMEAVGYVCETCELNIAITCETVQDGPYRSFSTWKNGRVPSIGDKAVILHSIQ